MLHSCSTQAKTCANARLLLHCLFVAYCFVGVCSYILGKTLDSHGGALKHHLPEHLRDPRREEIAALKYGTGLKLDHTGPYKKTWGGSLFAIGLVILVLFTFGAW